jgi:hypothetical protein
MSDDTLTTERWAEFRARTDDFSSYQDENGIDLPQIDDMLALTPTQRLEALEREMAFDDALTEARVKYYGSDPRVAVEAEIERR